MENSPGDNLKAEVPFVAKVVGCLYLPYKNNALYPNAISAVLVVARLVGDGHSWFESSFDVT